MIGVMTDPTMCTAFFARPAFHAVLWQFFCAESMLTMQVTITSGGLVAFVCS
jgi:hypothetical protein